MFGSVKKTVFFQHTASHEAIVLENVDTLVVAHGYRSNSSLKDSLSGCNSHIVSICDCVQPRSVEEAVLEGLKVATEI